jgi:polar amino acid transport system permease protein
MNPPAPTSVTEDDPSITVSSPTAPPTPDDLESRLARTPVAHRPHPARWLATAFVLLVVAQVVHGFVTNSFFEWDKFGYWFLRPVVVEGLVVTLKVTAWSAVLGLLGGILLALARLSRNPLLRSLSWTYVWLFRSIPLIVLLLFLFNLAAILPHLGVGIPFGPSWGDVDPTTLFTYEAIGILGLSLNEAAYAAEVVRAGVLSVDQGQTEAANALGLSKLRQFRRIVLPQALRSIVPAYVNQLIGLIKASSLVYYVSLVDLFGAVELMGSTYPTDIIPLLMVATVWYIILTSILSVVQYYVERYDARGAVRTLPPTPLQRLRGTIASWSRRADREVTA